MPNKKFSEIVCIIDRSGSMSSILDDAIGGFNTFLAEQKKFPGNVALTLVQFDDQYKVVHENKPLAEVPDLNCDTFVPRGVTALLDAIGKTIKNVGARLQNTPKNARPEKVVVAILTDGHENASRVFSRDTISEMISHQKEKYSWEFIFLAANQDAIQEGARFGIAAKDAVSFKANGVGVRSAYTTMSDLVATYLA